MKSERFVAYYRVSTARQGASGLGLEAQRCAVAEFLSRDKRQLVCEFVEVESGRRNDRPQLAAALTACRQHHATLVIAKLDRLARDAHFLLGLEKAGVEFVAVDMPSANRLTIGILALVAEEEARAISDRTKVALAAAKARGVTLGNPKNLSNSATGAKRSAEVREMSARCRAADLAPILAELRSQGVIDARGIARALNERRIPAPRGGLWQATQVQRIKSKLADQPYHLTLPTNGGRGF
jgi:DNA invertase Pin-like site-specific DNA recombinase